MSRRFRDERRRVKVAISGNPNVGKSVIFNELTGGRAWVGNWPGVTVEKKVGTLRLDGLEAEVVDLPGIYGLTAYSVDERIARDFIVNERPELIVNIASAANLERGIYLTLSLLELHKRVILVVNMMDIAEGKGMNVDVEKLSRILGIPVVATVAVRREGIPELLKRVAEALRGKASFRPPKVSYGPLEEHIARLEAVLAEDERLRSRYPLRWLAVKLLEGDADIEREVSSSKVGGDALALAEEARRRIREELGVEAEELVIEARYGMASRIASEVVEVKERVTTITELLDSVLLHRALGVLVAVSTLYLAFRFSFEVSKPLSTLIDLAFSEVISGAVGSLPLPAPIRSFLADAVVAGVGSIMVFLPVIAFFYIALAVLEDVGYMARIAFLADRVMTTFRLSGHSVIPLVVGFGCNVPGVIAARAIADEDDRRATCLSCPLVSCSARLPVFLLLTAALFGAGGGTVVLSLYVLSIALALLTGAFFRRVVFRGPSTGFIMEIPDYSAPLAASVLVKTWERVKRFLFKAGSVILAGVAALWLASVTGPGGYIGPAALERPELLAHSWVGVLGRALEPAFSPLGWDWRAVTALIFGFIAKEVVVGSLAMLYGVGEEGLLGAVAAHFTPLSAYAYMLFVLAYVPCVATIAAIRGEIGAKYAAISVAYQLALAYALALAATAAGRLVGLA
ncbi:ferrous iron transport protein B [Candidatus Geothermarchaeota archaeon ex4572_27]|nr:MAG: ferrous iron transport protein B [Candidatus Geothermarchaeota archaeon ex4572_27]